MVANGETMEIIRQVVLPLMIGKDIKHVSFRLVPKLTFTSILVTDMIKNLKITLNYDTGTWWHQIEKRRQKQVRRIVMEL